VANPLVSLGAALSKAGRSGEAMEALERALSIEISADGNGSPLLATVLNNIASVQEDGGAYAETLETHDRVLDLIASTWGADHPQAGLTQINRTSVLRRTGRFQDALDAAREARRILVTAFGPEHPYTAYATNSEGVILHVLGRHREAATAFEASLRIREEAPTDPLEAAETRLSLARALCAAGDRVRSRAEARRAREVFREIGGPRAAEDLRLLEEWMSSGGCG